MGRHEPQWVKRGFPSHTMQDWLDIDFAISEGVDFIAVSFVKTPDVMNNLKSYCAARSPRPVEIIAKIESFDSVPNLQDIVEASDGVMVARGDLGKQVQQSRSVHCCSQVIACSI